MDVQENPNAEGEVKSEKKYDVDDRIDHDKNEKGEDRHRDERKNEVSKKKVEACCIKFVNVYRVTDLTTNAGP